jgi:hypothetical protein
MGASGIQAGLKACATAVLVATVVLVAILASSGAAQTRTASNPAADPAPGAGTLYMGGWPDRIFVIDEASGKVTGNIPLKHGAPRALHLSGDRKKFYVRSIDYEYVEVVDIAGRKVLDDFTLSEGGRKVRIASLTPDPLDRFLILLVKPVEQKIDRFAIEPPALLVYDLAKHEVSRTIPWPEGQERDFVSLMMSPDGKLLYLFSDDVLIFETAEFKQVDRWEMSRVEEGFGRFQFGNRQETWEEPGYFTSLFTVQDPVARRRMMGIARVNLVAKKVESFYTVGPARGLSFALAPDRTRAYGLAQQVGNYEFWAFDLEGKRVLDPVRFDGRPRMSLSVSSSGRVLYIHGAGNTIDLYDASTYRFIRQLELDFDSTTDLFVFPPAGPAPKSGAAPAR